MQLIYKGKTKDVYNLGNSQYLLKFKDDVTGENGVFDPGANTVGLTIDGAGKSGLKMTKYFYELLNGLQIPTHLISVDLDDVSMVVKEAEVLGKGLEVICRYKAVGSFYRRYAAYCQEGQDLNGFVEVTIKDDERGDPVISEDALENLGILTKELYQELKALTVKICDIVKAELAKKGLDLYDIKLEFGYDKTNNQIILIDEISGGNMRVYKNGQYIAPLDLEKEFLA
ncbi:MAG: phosphoribosylaminoimidazolesuccinocarboxamide synthase [Sphingobacterium sp.]|jgi:phosphoribosylaminoimidazole-succinocarboxamide synthase|uniref:phosphoribosylaminoimidazolesuccinocarboxamide synthase n=1 Tax=Sphingobacterium yanglingense TaxID=1437280 RepID=A0A4R6WFW5_9SPHI|nr:phosphoribosylaminoimidazolesuccinocarboxamide synthase [Sphingobacterium yanglingense]MDR2285341.1 phosphoribosylaminoimidazolesuccinocarboxamide synthase [Sphingobacterium sp.]TDQ76530.1 phosphoribosylaminoimidazole-succinocarboxamide synthase [Sphingobacterium yanglingense]